MPPRPAPLCSIGELIVVEQVTNRYFCTVRRVAHDGGLIVERVDGIGGEVYVTAAHAYLAGVRLAVDDQVELSIFRGKGFNVILAERSGPRHVRVLVAD
jgi:hypothetical protein